jgi:hypothetical protein
VSRSFQRGHRTGRHFVFLEDFSQRGLRRPGVTVLASAGEVAELIFDPYCASGLVPLELPDGRRIDAPWNSVRRLSPLEEIALAASGPEAS